MTNDVIAYVLDGLADYLELERELGVRTLEVERKEIGELANNRIIESRGAAGKAPAAKAKEISELANYRIVESKDGPGRTPLAKAEALTRGTGETRGTPHSPIRPFVFIADGSLSPKAAEIMAKIVPALGQTPETAPVVVAPPIPDARFFVFLGQSALAKYVPGLHGEANRWLKSPKGRDVLLVTSPEDIVRFKTVTPACRKMKQEMWLALKTLRQRAELGL